MRKIAGGEGDILPVGWDNNPQTVSFALDRKYIGDGESYY